YQYRARMMVDYYEYFGLTEEITIPAVQTFVPDVSTGIAVIDSPINPNMYVNDNVINDDGNDTPILGYGILFTIDYSQDLVYTNVNVDRVYTLNDYPTNTPFSTPYGIGVNHNINVFYRAYAENSTGFGYGEIKKIETPKILIR
ncbi:MAG: hypothetical protein PF487_00945, partial [Bacteroidales bacterium]|nr:hypothetical protein [Bacteroidales bacterium]